MAEDNASPEVAPGWFASASTGEAVPPLATSGYAPPEQDHRAWIEDKAYQIIDEARTALGDYTAKDIRTAARNLTRWLYGEIEDTHGVPMPSASLTDVAKMRKAMTEAQAQADKARTEASAAEAELTLVKAEATRLKAHLDDEMASRDAEVAKHNAHLDSITEAFHRWANTHHAGDTFDEALASVGLPKRMHVYAVPVDVVVSATVQVEATTAREAREQVVKMTQPQRLQHISEKDQALTHKAMSIQPNSNPAWQVKYAMPMVLYYLLSSLAALRITRFIVIDDLGHWTIKGPYQRYAVKVESERIQEEDRRIAAMRKHGHSDLADVHEERFNRAVIYPAHLIEPLSLRQKISHGLDCPYCVGTWVSLGTLAIAAHASRSPKTKARWALLAGALATSYLIGQVMTRLENDRD